MAATKKDPIARYAFKVPLLFEGDRGSGKTYDVREFARTHNHPYVEIAGHESVEAIDFLGHHMQSPMGMVWKDGRLSRAFRQAAAGGQVALLIDEMLRIPQRHLSVLLSALSPDSTGHYRLQTGRMVDVVDGVGVEEEIVCPVSSLAIFATTNVGPEFAIDDLDPAVAERFIIVRKDTEKATLESILRSACAKRSFPSACALRLSEFFERTKRMVDTGTLNRHATTRTLARALEQASDESDIKAVLKDQILLWVDRDSAGRPVDTQAKQIERAIDELFPDRPTVRASSGAPGAGKSAPRAPSKALAPKAAPSPWIAKADMADMADFADFFDAEALARDEDLWEGAAARAERESKASAAKVARSISKPSSPAKVDSQRVELVKGAGSDRQYMVLAVVQSKSDPKLWAMETSLLRHDRRSIESRQNSPTSYSAAVSNVISAKKTALAAGYAETSSMTKPEEEAVPMWSDEERDDFGETAEVVKNAHELSRQIVDARRALALMGGRDEFESLSDAARKLHDRTGRFF